MHFWTFSKSSPGNFDFQISWDSGDSKEHHIEKSQNSADAEFLGIPCAILLLCHGLNEVWTDFDNSICTSCT